jgi:phosphoglycerate dehydrogenase-like enzyme
VKICLSAEIADAYGERIAAAAPASELVRIERDGSFSGDTGEVEVFFFSEDLVYRQETAAAMVSMLQAPSVRWMQSVGAGVDHPVFASMLERGVRLTNASGIHAEPMAQYALAHLLFWERKFVEHLAAQARREWARIEPGELTGKTVGIAGMGGIGRALARLAKACGMRVLGTKRTALDDVNVDELLPPDQLHRLLSESHYVVLALPLTNETRNLLGERELAMMRDDAVLINVARGAVVDEKALIHALRRRQFRGATLDVFAEEPLPADSPLWELDNCVITPHNAGLSPLGNRRLAELFLDNLGRYARGEPLRNEIRATGLSV